MLILLVVVGDCVLHSPYCKKWINTSKSGIHLVLKQNIVLNATGVCLLLLDFAGKIRE